jgi:hypothetical protein
MTSIVVDAAWFNLASDLSQSITMVLTGESDMTSRPVDVRRYAGGRVRSVTRPGTTKQLSLSFELADRADMLQLEDWIGTTVLYRDPRGRRLWGVFGAVDEGELPGVGEDTVNVNLTFSQITFDESV